MSLLESKRDTGTQKEFWDIFRKISPKNRKDPVQPSMEKFFDHFQNLSKSARSQTNKGPLDYEIELDELEYASKKIRLRKGYDQLCNDMILGLIKTYPKVLVKLFNDILQ